jgi:hypothetical protein
MDVGVDSSSMVSKTYYDLGVRSHNTTLSLAVTEREQLGRHCRCNYLHHNKCNSYGSFFKTSFNLRI